MLQGTHFREIYYAKSNQKKAGVAALTSDKIDFKTKDILREKKGGFSNDKRKQEHITGRYNNN